MVWAVSLSTADLSTRSLTTDHNSGIRSLSEIVDPHPSSALLKNLDVDASPKAISERTSYLQVRLEFSLLPKSSKHFSTCLVRLSAFTAPSTFSFMGRSHGSGLRHDAPYSDSRFPTAPSLQQHSHHNVTRRFILQKSTLSPINGLELTGVLFPLAYLSLTVLLSVTRSI